MNIDFNTKEELIEFKEGLLKNMDSYYEEKIEQLKLERERVEKELKLDKLRYSLIAIGSLIVILSIIICMTIILYGSTIEIDNTATSNSYGNMLINGDTDGNIDRNLIPEDTDDIVETSTNGDNIEIGIDD